MKTNSKKDSAVSPVIGTILLVAITVVLVAIISAVVMGMTGNIGTSKTVGAQIALTGDNKYVATTITGGADAQSVTGFVVIESAGGNVLLDQTTKPAIGTPYNSTKAGTTGKQTINVVANFTDGTQQTIYTGSVVFN